MILLLGIFVTLSLSFVGFFDILNVTKVWAMTFDKLLTCDSLTEYLAEVLSEPK